MAREFISEDKIHSGHRARMRAKLAEHGQFIFDTYELLEMLLYSVVPMKDTNPTAKQLLAALGGLDGVFSASKEELLTVPGIGERAADMLLSAGNVEALLAEENDDDSAFFSNYDKVGGAFVEYFAGRTGPAVAMMMLDNNMGLIALETVAECDFDNGSVRPRLFIDAALRCRASVIITAHCHPHGPLCPTPGDRATNLAVSEALSTVGVMHIEHFVITGSRYVGTQSSFKSRLAGGAVDEFDESRSASAEPESMVGYAVRSNYREDHLSVISELIASFSKGAEAGRISRMLIDRYRTFSNALSADLSQLSDLLGAGLATHLKLVAYVTSRRGTERFAFGKKHTAEEISEYFKFLYVGASVEITYLMLFDAEDRALKVVKIGEGTVNSSEVIPRKMVEAAISVGAASALVVHNHPLGNYRPSADDLSFTAKMTTVFETVGIKLRGHMIVAGRGANLVDFSML